MSERFAKDSFKKAERDLAYAEAELRRQSAIVGNMAIRGMANDIDHIMLRQLELSVIVLRAHRDILRAQSGHTKD